MGKTRKTIDREVDTLVYLDEKFVIWRKWGSVEGTMSVPVDLVYIGLEKLKESLDHLKYKKDKLFIIDDMIDTLKVIKLEIDVNEED